MPRDFESFDVQPAGNMIVLTPATPAVSCVFENADVHSVGMPMKNAPEDGGIFKKMRKRWVF